MIGSIRTGLAAALISGAAAIAAFPVAAEEAVTYEVKITNVTSGHALESGLVFTPFIVATHQAGLKIFTPGEPASSAIEQIAEGGNIDPLDAELSGNPQVRDIAKGSAPLLPGQSVTFELDSLGVANHISLAAMLLPTNDGLIALVDEPLPAGEAVFHALGYDAGTETNDEKCQSIPGPHCGGEAFSPLDAGEGYVSVHPGTHGKGNLSVKSYDWRNPVAIVRIMRLTP